MRNIFITSIGISLFLHATAILGVPNLNLKPITNNVKKIHEIRLIKKNQTQQNTAPIAQPPKYIPINVPINLAPQTNTAATAQAKAETAKSITLSDENASKEIKKIPAYANYYHLIRDKIRSKAFSYYDSSTTGEMFLSFTILSDGKLDALQVKGESIGSEYLRQIAIESIKDASPFPQFPEELKKYERLQFSISISFKND